MFGIGLPELIVIFVVALIVVGPEKLPDLAKSLARHVVELKKAAHALKSTIEEGTREKPWDLLAGGDNTLPQPPISKSSKDPLQEKESPSWGKIMEDESSPPDDETSQEGKKRSGQDADIGSAKHDGEFPLG